MIRVTITGGIRARQCGKSLELAETVARALKDGHLVFHGATGERIIAVPGFDDGQPSTTTKP